MIEHLINADLSDFDEWAAKLEKAQHDMPETQAAVQTATKETRQRFYHNLSGNPVNWSGGTFVIGAPSGTLRRHIESHWPLGGDPFNGWAGVREGGGMRYAGVIIRGASGRQRVQWLIWGGKGPSGFTQQGPNAGRAYKHIGPLRLYGGKTTVRKMLRAKGYKGEVDDASAKLVGAIHAGSKGHSRWFNFATITEDTELPDLQARPFDKATHEQMREQVRDTIRQGMLKDIGVEAKE